MERERVLGIDACKPGWIGVTLDDGGTSASFSTQVSDLAGQARAGGPILVVAIDMPIGLPDRGRRAADVLARAAVGPLRSSVFMTPVRAALEADDHPSAVAVNRELAGEGISVQAFGLKTKLFQVESWIREAGYRVVEVHPEVCFAQLAGAPLSVRKATWAGAERRRDLLARAGVTLAGDLGVAGRAAPLTTSSMLQWPHGRLDGSLAARPAPCQTRPRPSPTDSGARSGHDSLETIKPGR